jgi:glycosyltransferase involved in cell wall biosynthesis
MNIIIDLRPLNGGNHSGVEIYLKNIVKALLSNFPEHHFYLYNNSFHPQPHFFQDFQSPNATFVQTAIPNKIFNLVSSYFPFFKIDRLIEKNLKQQHIKFDAFYMPDLRPFQISKHIQSFATIHDIAFLHFPQFYSLKSKIWYKIIRTKKLLQRINHLIAVSDFTRSDLIKTLHLPPQKITTIYPGLPPLEKVNNFSQLKKLYNLPDKYFLTLSTIEPRKNLQRIIKSFQTFSQNFPECQLIIAGSSNTQIFQTEQLTSNSKIRFIGFIPENHKYQLIKNSQALIYASLFEGFGFPILEAQQAQTNVITSRTSSMPEVAGPNAIFTDPYSQTSLTQALEQSLIQNHSPANNLKKFSWQNSAQKLIEVFSKKSN